MVADLGDANGAEELRARVAVTPCTHPAWSKSFSGLRPVALRRQEPDLTAASAMDLLLRSSRLRI